MVYTESLTALTLLLGVGVIGIGVFQQVKGREKQQ